jgi:copper chaperone
LHYTPFRRHIGTVPAPVARRFLALFQEAPLTLLSVPDMTCGHCKASVEAALSPLPGMAPVEVDLTSRQVKVAGPAEAALKALEAIGFPATKLA